MNMHFSNTASGRNATASRFLSHPAFPLLLLLALLAVSACGKIAVNGPSTPDAPQAEKSRLLTEADKAWHDGQYSQAMQLYDQLSARSDLAPAERELSLERFAISAVEGNQPQKALDRMTAWATASPQSRQNQLWQETYIRALAMLPDPASRERQAMAVANDFSNPPGLALTAQAMVAGLRWAAGDVQTALASLRALASQAIAANFMGRVEETVFNEARFVSSSNLEALAMLVDETGYAQFPYTIYLLEKARRLAQPGGDPAMAWSMFQQTRPLLANPALVDELVASISSGQEMAAIGVVLALPLSGQYADFGWNVLRGAGVAQWELAQAGLNISVEAVNTEASDYAMRIASLPDSYSIIGGPLRPDVYESLMTSQAGKRAIFAFMRDLPSGMEGKDAWRFFPSREDQVRSLLELAVNGLGIRAVSILHPEEPFGNAMAQLFREEAQRRSVTITGTRSYPPGDHATWGSIAGDLANGPAGEAIFIPGDWAHAEMLVPYLRYYSTTKRLIMGPALWGQTLTRRSFVAEDDFRTSVFPGTWWPDNPSLATVALHERLESESLGAPDFWTAMGYDFVRFAVRVGDLNGQVNPAQLNARILDAQTMPWAMAPMVWDTSGRCRQDLFILRPAEGGFTAADLDTLRSRLGR